MIYFYINRGLIMSYILTDPENQWKSIRQRYQGKNRYAFRKLDVDWQKYNIKDYLFTHDTACCSVETQKNGYWLKPACFELVNANGNAWTNPVLLASFKTFIGGDNFLQHCQLPALSKGKILDAIIRPVKHHSEKYNEDANVYYVDILIATDRKHVNLIDRIQSGKLTGLSMGCGKSDCKISMSDGSYKDIIDIQIGDEVLTHKGRVRKVTNLFQFDVQEVPLYKLYANSLDKPVQLTGEHPVLIIKSQDIRCNTGFPCKLSTQQSQCKRNKKCNRDKSNYEYPMDFIPISQLKKGDYLVKSFDTEIKDIEQLSKEWCRLFGLYMGDGFLCWTLGKNNDGNNYKKNPCSVQFSFNLKEIWLKDLVFKLVKSIDQSIQIKTRQDVKRNALYVKVFSKKLAEEFFAFGNQGAHNKKFDEKIMKLPCEKQLQIIAGMFDTDGCFYEKTKALSWTTVSFALFNQLHLMLLRNKIANLQSSIYRKPGKNGVLYNKNQYSWQYTISISKSNNGIIPSIKNTNFGSEIKDYNQVSFFYKNYYLCPIKKIEKEYYTGKVYNFSVEEDNSYLVNNVAVHNCIAEVTQCSICGKKIYDGDRNCEHIDKHLGQLITCSDGKERICAELCGACDENGEYIQNSNKFIQQSWVENPAFSGSVINAFVQTPQYKKMRLQEKDELAKLFQGNLFERLKVADTDSKIALDIVKQYAKIEKINRISKNILDIM